MGKPNKSRKSNNPKGKGKVTPVQVAFIVDHYLSDNNFTQTLSIFRSEASNLVSKYSAQQAPKSLLSLTEILDEYIRLKEQKVIVNQERLELEREKLRVQNLLKGMQDAMNAYNYKPSLPVAPLGHLTAGSEAGAYPVCNTSVAMSAPTYVVTQKDTAHVYPPVTYQALLKRRESAGVLNSAGTAKRSRKCSNTTHLPTDGCIPERTFKDSVVQPLSHNENTLKGSSSLGSRSAKGPLTIDLPQTNCSETRMPPASTSQADNSTFAINTLSFATPSRDINSHHITSTNSTIISSQIIQISPEKQIALCSIENNQSISISSPAKTSSTKSTRRDRVKGRLNFDASELEAISENQLSDAVLTSEPDRDCDPFDIDIPNLDSLCENLNISELLLDFDLCNADADLSAQASEGSSPDMSSVSPNTSGSAYLGTNHFGPDRSNVAKVISEECNLPGQDTVTTVQSITKRIKIITPEKRWMV